MATVTTNQGLLYEPVMQPNSPCRLEECQNQQFWIIKWETLNYHTVAMESS